MNEPQSRCGFIAVIGAPNAGKSTLVNALVGAKVAIVSPRVQTTRSRLMGIAMAGASQLVLIDTPGIFAPRRRLDRAMVAAAWTGAAEADITLLLVDAKQGITEDVEAIVASLERKPRPLILVLNKIDLLKDRSTLLTLSQSLNARVNPRATFMVSALNGSGVEDLKAHLSAQAPVGPWHFPADQLSDISQRLLAAELTREQLYLQLYQELPYAAAVDTIAWRENQNGSVRIEQNILVERQSQKAIVIGAKGARLKKLGTAARLAIEEALGRKAHLFLYVKVAEDWAEDREHYRNIGLDWTK